MASTTCLVKLMKGSDWDISVMRWFLLVPAESGRGEDLGSLSQMCVCVHVSKIGQTMCLPRLLLPQLCHRVFRR